jgi:hypothetical protein
MQHYASEREHHMTEPVSLADFRGEKFLRDLERGKYPALTAGSAPVRALVGWMEDGGMLAGDIIALLIYNAAAAAFLVYDSPEQAEEFVRDHVELVLADLRHNGPEP